MASNVFWETELRLRKIFDAYKSDEKSIEIAKHFDFESMRQIRRRNFKVLSENAKPNGWSPVFTALGLFFIAFNNAFVRIDIRSSIIVRS